MALRFRTNYVASWSVAELCEQGLKGGVTYTRNLSVYAKFSKSVPSKMQFDLFFFAKIKHFDLFFFVKFRQIDLFSFVEFRQIDLFLFAKIMMCGVFFVIRTTILPTHIVYSILCDCHKTPLKAHPVVFYCLCPHPLRIEL